MARMFSRAKWIALFSVACLTSVADSKLMVEGPDPFQYVFHLSNGEVQAQYANFGHIPYGQTLTGRVIYD